MEVENFDRTLNAFRLRVPFKPFTVVMVNGDRFEVDHSGAFFARDGMSVFIAPGGTPILFDHEGVSQFVGDIIGSKAAE